MDKTLEIALAKLRPFPKSKEWCACLGSAEIVALHKDGWGLTKTNNYQYEDILKFMKAGENSRYWCYYDKIGDHKPSSNTVKKEQRLLRRKI